MGPRWAQKGATHNDKISQNNSWSPLGPILGPILAIKGSTWPFPTNFETNMTSTLLLYCLQCHNTTTFQQLCCKTVKASELLNLRRQGRPQQPTHQRTNSPTHKPSESVRRNARSDPPPHWGTACEISMLITSPRVSETPPRVLPGSRAFRRYGAQWLVFF